MKLMGIAAAAMLVAAGAQAQTRLQLGHSLSQNSHYQAGAQAFADQVKEKTEGRYVIEIVPAGGLGSEREMVEGVQLGTIDLVLTSLGTVGSFVPETGVLDLPFLFEDLEHARRVIDGPVGNQLIEAVGQRGFVPLAWAENGIPGFITKGVAVSSAEDLKGLKMRTQANPMHTAAFEALGAQAVPLGFGEIYTAMQTGTIDGTYMVTPIVETSNFYQVQDYITPAPLYYQAAMFVMSPSAWDQVAEEDRQAFLDAAKAGGQATRDAVEKAESESLEFITANGMKVVEDVDLQSFKDAIQPVYDEFGPKLDMEMVEQIRAAADE